MKARTSTRRWPSPTACGTRSPAASSAAVPPPSHACAASSASATSTSTGHHRRPRRAPALRRLQMTGVGTKAGGPDYLLQFMEPRVITENTLRRGFAPPRTSRTCHLLRASHRQNGPSGRGGAAKEEEAMLARQAHDRGAARARRLVAVRGVGCRRRQAARDHEPDAADVPNRPARPVRAAMDRIPGRRANRPGARLSGLRRRCPPAWCRCSTIRLVAIFDPLVVGALCPSLIASRAMTMAMGG